MVLWGKSLVTAAMLLFILSVFYFCFLKGSIDKIAENLKKLCCKEIISFVLVALIMFFIGIFLWNDNFFNHLTRNYFVCVFFSFLVGVLLAFCIRKIIKSHYLLLYKRENCIISEKIAGECNLEGDRQEDGDVQVYGLLCKTYKKKINFKKLFYFMFGLMMMVYFYRVCQHFCVSPFRYIIDIVPPGYQK